MSELVDPSLIEEIVGAKRDWSRHIGRAVSETETFYILHSGSCLSSGADLRLCTYSHVLDELGIDPEIWAGSFDTPVVIGLRREGLVPNRRAA